MLCLPIRPHRINPTLRMPFRRSRRPSDQASGFKSARSARVVAARCAATGRARAAAGQAGDTGASAAAEEGNEALPAAEHPRPTLARARSRVSRGRGRVVVRQFDGLGDGRRPGSGTGSGHARHGPRGEGPPRRRVRRPAGPQPGRRSAASIRRRRRPRAPSSSSSSPNSTPTKDSTSCRARPPRSTIGNWDDVTEGQIVDVTVTGSNKGGLECQIAGCAASFRWVSFRCTASNTRKTTSASGWPAS